ncbi:hypothetical protein [Lactobacillus paragasseri]|uniref:hypothetical protein n=1 Tax=Lactobacillus paragasseri TaxID=2107999 RepID=UPI002073D104|nr:hypothetical protein [Lactobacillus paragasseri]
MNNFDCVDRLIDVMKKMNVTRITADEYVRYRNQLAKEYPKEFTPIRRKETLSLRALLSRKNDQISLTFTYDNCGKCTQEYVLNQKKYG